MGREFAEDDDVTGHGNLKSGNLKATDDDDVTGHGNLKSGNLKATDDDDVEGHSASFRSHKIK